MNTMRGIDPTTGRGINLNSMLLVSLAIHILVLSGGAFIQVSSTPRMTFGPVYSVQLVSMSAVLQGTAPSSSLSKEITAADSRDRTVILRKTSDALSKIPIQKMESSPTRNPQIDRALEEIRKKAAAEPAGPPRGGQQSRQASTDGNARFNDYYGAIWSRIKSQWALPGGILPKEALESIVHVRILRNGSLTDIYLDKRSRNTYFDNSALRAVTKSNPLPPLPEWFRESSLDVGIRFHSSELR
jgi:colicin import membrane protein